MMEALDLFSTPAEMAALIEVSETQKSQQKQTRKTLKDLEKAGVMTQNQDFGFEITESDAVKIGKKAFFKAPLAQMERLELHWNSVYELELELKLLTRTISILTEGDPTTDEWKWEAAWVFSPELNMPQGMEVKVSFEKIGYNMVVYMQEVGLFDDHVADCEDLRKAIKRKMGEAQRQAIETGAYLKDNPYPFEPK